MAQFMKRPQELLDKKWMQMWLQLTLGARGHLLDATKSRRHACAQSCCDNVGLASVVRWSWLCMRRVKTKSFKR